MIKKEIHCGNLQEYYETLKQLQEGEHTIQYTMVHSEIKKHLKECESYTEFGIMQGPTLALACLNGIHKIRAYDINLNWYNKAKTLFEQYVDTNNIDFKVNKENTLTCTIEPTDLLYIDSLHEYKHLKGELARHAPKVKKYIIMHDTTGRPELVPAIDEFLKDNPCWEKIVVCTESVGFMTIARKRT